MCGFMADGSTAAGPGEYGGRCKGAGRRYKAPLARAWKFRDAEAPSRHPYTHPAVTTFVAASRPRSDASFQPEPVRGVARSTPHTPVEIMRTLKAGFVYFLLVFAVGFALGAIRVPFVVPRLGVRWAELAEMPLMLLASFLAARFCVRRHGPFSAAHRVAVGALALALLVAAELGLTVALGQSVSEYIAGRDPVSGGAYLVSLAVFAALPLIVGRGQGPRNSIRPKRFSDPV